MYVDKRTLSEEFTLNFSVSLVISLATVCDHEFRIPCSANRVCQKPHALSSQVLNKTCIILCRNGCLEAARLVQVTAATLVPQAYSHLFNVALKTKRWGIAYRRRCPDSGL